MLTRHWSAKGFAVGLLMVLGACGGGTGTGSSGVNVLAIDPVNGGGVLRGGGRTR